MNKLPDARDHFPEEPTGRDLNDFRITMATPHSYDSIYKEWFAAYCQLIKPDNMQLIMNPNMPLDKNRNEAVEAARENGSEYLFFVDHDNILAPNTLVHMLQANVDIIGCLYFERKYPNLPLIYRFEQDKKTATVVTEYPKGLVICHATGLGCALIKMSVFDELDEPYFCYEYDGYEYGTEDLGFYRQCMDKEIKVHVDTNHCVPHLGMNAITEEDWIRNKKPYMQMVEMRAKEIGSNNLLLDKNKGRLIDNDE